ncbi:hypothetical protein GEV33_012631 [Tenebrio molitor]|uniref:Uncharacterized protein n=1 Tax=Tenebrio molitor TaxID=7067 RepID=A0A8J6L8Y4_TENMO|nr:hypothetical protein GEV33_012631 [Tenebrio molitor]
MCTEMRHETSSDPPQKLDYGTLTPSLWASGLGINLALAPQTPNFYPICVGSSKSLRHLTHSIWVQCPRLVSSETPLQIPTPDEPEAFHRGRSRSYTAKVTRHEKASQIPTPAISRRSFWCVLVFHCNVENLPHGRHP